MQNRHMERSAAYSGIVGAILYVIAGIVPGVPPPASDSTAQVAAYIAAHSNMLALGAWLTLPAVAFILWFAIGFFDYLRDQSNGDRTLIQWGVAGAIIWAALDVVSVSLMGAAAIHNPGTGLSLMTLYLFDVVMFIFGFGAFAAFAFAAANEGRRRGAMPGWLNAFGYLVFIVDALFTLTVFGNSSSNFAITGIGAMVTPLLSAVWVLVASIVLLTRIPKTA
jgi:hypothetical protein